MITMRSETCLEVLGSNRNPEKLGKVKDIRLILLAFSPLSAHVKILLVVMPEKS